MIKLHIEFLIFKSNQVSDLELLILRFGFGYLQYTTQLKLEVQKLALVKLAFEPLFILDILFWGMGNNPWDSFTRIERNEDLQVEIWSTKFSYAKQVKLTWDRIYWEWESNKATQVQDMQAIMYYHDCDMAHGQYVFMLVFCLFVFVLFTIFKHTC